LPSAAPLASSVVTGVALERGGYVEAGAAALQAAAPEAYSAAASSLSALLPTLNAVDSATTAAASSPVAAAAASSAEQLGAKAASAGGRRSGATLLLALVAVGAGVAVHKYGVKGVQRALRQARAGATRRACLARPASAARRPPALLFPVPQKPPTTALSCARAGTCRRHGAGGVRRGAGARQSGGHARGDGGPEAARRVDDS
jgi:hypothetical protein